MLVTITTLAALTIPTQDCHQPTAGFGSYGVAWSANGGKVSAMAVYDDGDGPALYVAGEFEVAGEIQVGSIARFDGSAWEALPGPGGASVVSNHGFGIQAMEVFDDGSGPALYVAGSFEESLGLPPNGIARWDGTTWTGVVEVSTQYGGFFGVTDMQVWDDGSGPALYFVGTFNKVEGQPAASIAKYTGSGWSTVGAGYTGSLARAMAVHDDGSGEKLFVAGWNHPSLQNVQVWDGSSWSINPGVFNSEILTLSVHDAGGGPELYAGGYFSSPGDGVARWDGLSWSGVGAGLQLFPWSLTTFDDGTGTQLYAVGQSYSVPPPGWEIRAARWNGSSWEYLGLGLSASAYTSLVFDDGSGPELFVGGSFIHAGDKRVDHVAKWTSAGWDGIYESEGFVGPSKAMTVFDDGTGPALYAAGGRAYVNSGGGQIARDSVVRWTGSDWTQIGEHLVGTVSSLEVFDAGGGSRLYVGGGLSTIGGVTLNGIACWNGSTWEPLGGGLTRTSGYAGSVDDLEVHDFGAGPRLVVAGKFDFADGVAAGNVAIWDGTAWSAIGSGMNDTVRGLAVFDDGVTGPLLYAGGDFESADGVLADHLARWTGSAWVPFGTGANRDVYVLETIDLGSGPKLYAGGRFYIIGGIWAEQIACFDGSSWEGVAEGAAGLSGIVDAIGSYDEGRGPELIAGGRFSSAGGKPIAYLARWDGAAWNAFSAPPSSRVEAFQVFDDGTGVGPALFVGGHFDSFGDTVSMCVARWAPVCPCDPAVYCTAQVNSQGCTPSIYTIGSPSMQVNTLRVNVANVINQQFGFLFWGRGPREVPLLGGWLCVAPPIVRTPVQFSDGNPPPDDCSGSFAFHFHRAYALSKGLAAGDWVYAQYWSRDPADPTGSNLSDAVRFLLCP